MQSLKGEDPRVDSERWEDTFRKDANQLLVMRNLRQMEDRRRLEEEEARA